MTALLEAPAGRPVRPVGRARRRRAVVLLALGVLAAVVVAALAVLAVRPPALRVGTTTFAGAAPVTTLPTYGARGMHVVYYADRSELRVTLPMRNRGPLPVTITSVDLGRAVRPLVVVTGASLPVTLWPGQEQDVELTARLDNCAWYHEREVQTYDGVRVGYEVLGRSDSRSLALDRPLMVRSPMIVGCPDRKLDRTADNRTGPGRLAP